LKAFLITAPHETQRREQVSHLFKTLPFFVHTVDAVYPTHHRIPFQEKLIALSEERTGKALLPGELGCLMSHRKIWRNIVREQGNEQQHFLILESDSELNDPSVLSTYFSELTAEKDLFFWGAWEGHMKLFLSSKSGLQSQYTIGEPFIKTTYCTYGYSLNKTAARLLLKRTARISYPVDQFKRFFKQNELRMGGILPEVITGNNSESTIRERESKLLKKIFLHVLDFKNNLICNLR